MPGRFEDLEGDLAERDALAIVQGPRRELWFGARPEADLRAGRGGQLEMTREKVGVKMCLDDQLDRDFVFPRRVEVLLDVAARVNHHRAPRRLIADEI